MKTTRTAKRLLRTTVLTSALVALAAPAFAQDADTEADDLVIVTGSRIARDANLEAPTAVTTIGQEAITFSGETNLSSILRQIPSFGVSGLTASNTNFSLQSGGINTLELRNLGEDRTLVLQNGRRIVGGLPGSQAVDFNLIPADLIEKVEVITGGASSIYGSDALAGVVNVILKDDFEGVKFTSQYGQNLRHGDAEEYSFRLTVGGNFADGRGNAVVSAEYVNNAGIRSIDRPDTQVDDFALCRFTGDVNDCQTPLEPFFSSFPPQGRFIIEDPVAETSASFNPDGTPFNTNGGDFNGPGLGDGFNRQAFRLVSVPIERWGLNAIANYDLYEGDSFSAEAFVEGSYGSSFTSTQFEPVPLSSDDIFDQGQSIGVDINNPFVPQALRDLAIASGDDNIGFVRRTVELGARGNEALRETFRIVSGVRGTIWEDYAWEAFINYGRTSRSQETSASINAPNFAQALNAELDAEGVPQCADAQARAAGCVPINIFGAGAISQEAADYVRHIGIVNARIEQTTAGASFSGPVPGFALPAGEVLFASGLEWRREFSDNQPDGLQQAGLTTGNAFPGSRGQFEVWEGFFEVEIPVLKDVQFAEDLTVGAAYRFSDYSTIGNTHAYSVNANWQPIEDLRIRAQYARAVRAPNIGELFDTGTENFAPVSDPCDGLSGLDAGDSIAITCRQDPLVQVRLNATGDFVLTQPEQQGTGGRSGGGNLNLDPEIGKSFNVGLVYTRDFGAAGTTAFSADYFDIDIEGAILQPGRQQAVTLCYQSEDFANNPFCRLIVRDNQGVASTQGEIDEVNTSVVNAGFLATAGIDFAISHTLDLANVGFMSGVSNAIPAMQDPGTLTLRTNYTFLTKYESETFGIFEDDLGEVGIPKHEILAGLTYANGPLTFSWDAQWMADTVVDDETALFDFNVGAYMRHDMQIRYSFKDGMVDTFFGINDVFDRDLPVILGGIPGNDTGTDTNANVFNPTGRSFYAGATFNF